MKTAFKFVGWMLLAALLLSMLLVATGAAWLTPLAHATIQIDDDTWTFPALHGSDWLIAVVAVLAAVVGVLLALLIVPVALLLPLLMVALALGVAVFAVVGFAALLVSPLLLVGWLAWRLLRSEKPRSGTAAATISA